MKYRSLCTATNSGTVNNNARLQLKNAFKAYTRGVAEVYPSNSNMIGAAAKDSGE